MLKQLGHAKEQRRSLLRRERLAHIQQVDDTRQQRATFSRLYGGLVEASRFLYDGRLVVVERCYRQYMARCPTAWLMISLVLQMTAPLFGFGLLTHAARLFVLLEGHRAC